MTITERRSGDALILALTGALDGFTASVVDKELLHRLNAGETRLVIDLSGTDYISSVGLGVLIHFNKRVAAVNGRLYFCGLSESVYRFFEVSGLFLLLDIKANCAEALSSLATA